jgi:hypothetical protein
MIHGEWLSCAIDTRDSEFTGDDVDRYTKLVNLGRPYERLMIEIPTITSAQIYVYPQSTAVYSDVPKELHHFDNYTGKTTSWAVDTNTGGITVACDALGGYQYVRLYSSANQTFPTTFMLCGVRS